MQQNEIVNVPDWSTHNRIGDSNGNVWIIEPGRGSLYVSLCENDYQVITNESILDNAENKKFQCTRYHQAVDLLSRKTSFDVADAFELLKQVKQNGKERVAECSFVYDRNENTVYYCEDQKYHDIRKHTYK